METLNYRQEFLVRWSDIDPNMHMRHTIYSDFCDSVRVDFLNQHGFNFMEFKKLMIGPIIFSTESIFFKEVTLGERVTVNVKLLYISEDRRKYGVQHEITKENGDLAAVVKLNGAWMDLKERKVIVAPDEVYNVWSRLERAEEIIAPGK